MTADTCLDNRQRGLASRARRFAAAALVLAVWGCSPNLDWRQFQPKGWPLQVALPCRPDYHDRQVTLGGRSVKMEMVTCQADELTFAVSRADLLDPALVAASLAELGQAAKRNLAGRVMASTSTQVPGMTPQSGAFTWHLAGQRADGQPVQMRLALFAHGTWVYQATVVGVNLAPGRAQPLFDSLAVRP